MRPRQVLTYVARAPARALKWTLARRWRVLTATTLLIFSALLGGSYGGYKYWSSPGFCYSCHIMEPYYESWEASSHAGVVCVDCHFEPGIGNELHGKWVAVKQLASTLTGAYSSMPYARVADASCLRSGCHSPQELQVPVDFSGGGIRFDHAAHLGGMRRDMELACTSCHYQRLVTEHMRVDESICFMCHFKPTGVEDESGIGDCATCHGPPTEVLQIGSFDVVHADYAQRGMECFQCHSEAVSTNRPVEEERCLSCHNRPEQIARMGDFGFLHVEHVTNQKMHCYECHSLIEHGLNGGTFQEQDCASCHGESIAPQALFYAGQGAKGVPSVPNAMHSLGLDCVGCHGQASPASLSVHGAGFSTGGAESCESCHGDRYADFVATVPGVLTEMRTNLVGRLEAVQQELAAKTQAQELLDPAVYRASVDTEFNLQLLENIGYLHNPLYGIEILRHGHRALTMLEESTGIPTAEDKPEGFEPFECFVCHDALPEPGSLDLGDGRLYLHSLHLDETGMDCTDCHTGDTHPPRAIITGRLCSLCHGE